MLESKKIKKSKKKPNFPKAPTYLTAIAKKKWNELAPMFADSKLLKASDLTALETLCINYSMSLELYNAMIAQSTDSTIAGYFAGRNSQTMGEYNAYYKCQATYTRLLTEFGMTPRSRSKIPTEVTPDAEDDITKMINGNDNNV